MSYRAASFLREDQALLSESFVQVLQLAQALKLLQVGQFTTSQTTATQFLDATLNQVLNPTRP